MVAQAVFAGELPPTLDPTLAPDGSPSAPRERGRVVTRVEVSLLGGFRVRVGGRTISPERWSRRHSAAVVKLLALAPRRVMHRERVIDALWPDLTIDEAAPRLHKAAHYARRVLGRRDAVVLSADSVSLFPHDDVLVDVKHFQRLAESAVDNGGLAAAKRALAVYGGELLPQDPYAPWAEEHRDHLGRLYIDMLHQAEDWHRVLLADPADEPAHLALAGRYAERGDRAAALRQLGQLDRAMRDELGLEPSKRALDLRRQLVAPSPSRAASVAAEATPEEAPPAEAEPTDVHRRCCAPGRAS
ncbi:MAG: AfsR/SARP family transcriptional regulator [Frankiaceae bacterium]